MFPSLIEKLRRQEDLSTAEAADAMATIMRGEAAPAQIAGLLIGLGMKGERPTELVGFAQTMRANAVPINAAAETVFDTCGTGGDRSGTFNISTASAIVLAACGMKIAKHGNRSVSSQCGSADVLEALGVNIQAPAEIAAACLDEVGIAFLFAPTFHPAMKHAAQARKDLGVRTAFNLLGPLTNPARPSRQIVGVPRPELTELLARSLSLLGSERAWVVHGADGLDELSTTGYTKVSECRGLSVQTFYVHPADFGLAKATPEALKGGNAATNAAIVRSVLAGEQGRPRDVVLLNAGAALFVGGEYSAINSAIDEMVPARVRGAIALAVNGSYWVGVAFGAGVTLIVLNPSIFPVAIGWRVAFGFGALLGLAILLVRRHMPESPRWLLMHGHVQAAIATIERIEAQVRGPGWKAGTETTSITVVTVKVSGTVGLRHLAHTLIRRYPRRTVYGLSLMLAQAFLYNSIFFSYGLILERFHGVPADHVGLYIVPFAIGNFLGPLVLGPLFDRWGRRVMIPLTYALSGVLLLATGGLFVAGVLNALTQTLAWMLVFFVASAAASSAYLTVSELFPVELRGMAIAVFYAFGTLVGAGAPTLFGAIVDAGDPRGLLAGYALASAMMIAAAGVGRVFGVDAERRSLEEITSENPPSGV